MGFDPEFDDDSLPKLGSPVTSRRTVAMWCAFIALAAMCITFGLQPGLLRFDPTADANVSPGPMHSSGTTAASLLSMTAAEPSYHLIVNRETGQCLDVPYGSLAPRARVEQFPVNGGANQVWRLDAVAGGSVRIINRHSGQCLDIPFGTCETGTPVEQFPGNGGANQGWKLVSAGDHWYRIENDWTGLCLEVPKNSTARRTIIEQAAASGGTNQHWRPIAVR